MNRERIRETIRASRQAQGLPATVTDARLLFELAAEVVDPDADTVEFPAVVVPLRVAGGGGGRGSAA